MKRPVFLFLAFFSLCLASTLYLFGGSASAAETRGYGTKAGELSGYRTTSVYGQHLEEAIERLPQLAAYLEDYAAKETQNRQLLQATYDYLGHIDTYFREARAEAGAIRDSSLRVQVLATLEAREADALAQTAGLRKTLADYNTLQPLATDYKKAAEIMGSLSSFETYLKAHKVDTTGARKAILNTYNLIEDGKKLVQAPL